MEAKKFISTLKSVKTRYSKNPNAEAEKKAVETLLAKVNMEEIELPDELNEYIKGFINTEEAAPVAETTAEEVTTEEAPAKLSAKVTYVDDKGVEHAETSDGRTYVVDSVSKTVKRVYDDFKKLEELDTEVLDKTMPLTTYQRYLKDHFDDEDAPIKKGKLHFRGYRIYCDTEDGFVIEDTNNNYEQVETPFDGIPTPKELADFFRKPKVTHTPEELKAALERGKADKKERLEQSVSEDEEIDFEKLRKKVLLTIEDAKNGVHIDVLALPDMIPFRRWRKQIKDLVSKWKSHEIRYSKLLNEAEKITSEETFVIEEKRHRSKFSGTLLPEHEKVGLLVGDKIEVDGKWIDAVPFLVEYLLHYEKKAMSQLMKYGAGEITDRELLDNPIDVDWKVEYRKNAIENTAHNARLISMVYMLVGIVPPQDLLFEAELEVGDKILIDWENDGNFVTRKVTKIEKGIEVGKEVGLTKFDKWIKLPKKVTEEETDEEETDEE